MTGLILDTSFEHEGVTPPGLKSDPQYASVLGVTYYAGCDDSRKNVTKPEIDAMIEAGYYVSLVIENSATDLNGGAKVGAYQGQQFATAAEALGYPATCVGWLAADYNVTNVEPVLEAIAAFETYWPYPGIYGPSGLIDAAQIYGWQASADSWSPQRPTPNACLWQRPNGYPYPGTDYSFIEHQEVLNRFYHKPIAPPTPPETHTMWSECVLWSVGDNDNGTLPQKYMGVWLEYEDHTYIGIQNPTETANYIKLGCKIAGADANGNIPATGSVTGAGQKQKLLASPNYPYGNMAGVALPDPLPVVPMLR